VGALDIEYGFSSYEGGKYPLHKPELVEKAVKTANWIENRHHTVFLSAPREFKETEVHPGQRTHFCNALMALTREEAIALYDTLLACRRHEAGLQNRDFTSQVVRDRLPHIYAPEASDAAPSKQPAPLA